MRQNKRSPVTFNARAKLLSLIDGKFGVFFKSHPQGSLEIHIMDSLPRGDWIQIENYPRVFVDQFTLKRLRPEVGIDFEFDSQEFVIPS